MLPIQKKISAYNHYKNENTIKYIVIHYTGNKGDTAKNNVDYFSGGNRNASAHYFVDDNSIWQSVEDKNGAFHVGDGKGKYRITNKNSLGIEMCCNKSGVVSSKTESNVVELTKYLMSKYGISASNVVRHYDASKKSCPNWSSNSWSRWVEFKKKIVATNSTSSYKVYADYVGSRCKELQTKLNKLGYDCGTADGIFGKNTYNSLVKFQSDYSVGGLDERGYAGKKTFTKLDELIAKKEQQLSNNKTMYRVVVGTYSGKVNAQDQQNKLKSKGFDSFLVAYEKMYRVVVGTYSSKVNAEDQQKKLKSKGFDSFLVAIQS